MLRLLHPLSLVVTLIALLLLPSAAFAQCFATGDVNGDGVTLSVSDLTLLLRYLTGVASLPDTLPAYVLDLNGDCAIDAGDGEIFLRYFSEGLSVFANGYPVPTCCNPDTIRGACCERGDVCQQRTERNCMLRFGHYNGIRTFCDSLPPCVYICGDVSHDGIVDISDAVALVFCIFGCEVIPGEAEVDCNGQIDISDVVYLIGYIFGGGSAPCAGCP